MSYSSRLLLVLLFSIHLPALTQNEKILISAEGGPALAFTRGDLFFNLKNRPIFSWGAGAYFQYNFSKVIGLKTGIGFERKGDFYDGPFTPSCVFVDSETIRENLNYLVLPVLLKFHFGRQKNIFISFGPYFGYMTSYVVKAGSDYKEINKTGYSHADVGASFGAGYLLRLTKHFAMSFELQNELGCRNILSSEYYNANKQTFTEFLILRIGFAYMLKNKDN